jgi:hypothetical protein
LLGTFGCLLTLLGTLVCPLTLLGEFVCPPILSHSGMEPALGSGGQSAGCAIATPGTQSADRIARHRIFTAYAGPMNGALTSPAPSNNQEFRAGAGLTLGEGAFTQRRRPVPFV